METKSAENAPSNLEAHLGYWLRRVSNHVSGNFARALQNRQTSVAEWVLLRHLYDHAPSTPGELAIALTMTRGAISKIVDKLEAKNWIAAKAHPDDSRAQLLSLTRQGQRILPELAAIADRNDQQFFSSLSASEQATLRRLLIKLSAHHQIRETPLE